MFANQEQAAFYLAAMIDGEGSVLYDPITKGTRMSDTPSVPDGWTVFNTQYGDSLGVGAKKWFGDHYKDVVVDAGSGDLYAACAAIDLEAQLRADATTQAANATADDLEAQAAALRASAQSSVAPVTAEPAQDPVNETAPDAAPATDTPTEPPPAA